MGLPEIRAEIAARCNELETKESLSHDELIEILRHSIRLNRDESNEARELRNRLMLLLEAEDERWRAEFRQRHRKLVGRLERGEVLSPEEKEELNRLSEALSWDH